MTPVTATLYSILGVDPGATAAELRAAYRLKARESHPDLSPGVSNGRSMALLNDAWRILSDPEQRRLYDRSLASSIGSTRYIASNYTPQPPPVSAHSRRSAWVAGVRAQIGRLATLAGRSATQTLLLGKPRAPRETYDRLTQALVNELMRDTESRVRAARAAGTAPLDLGVAATLIGIRTLADQVRRDASHSLTPELMMTAELLDRMWDVLAYELTSQLAAALGGNPGVAHALRT